MAFIKENYDLSGGPVFTDEIDLPSSWRIKGIPSGCPTEQVVILEPWVQTVEGEYEVLTDENDARITKKIYGNTDGSVNPIVCNALKGKVKIIPPTDHTSKVYVGVGTISVESYNN